MLLAILIVLLSQIALAFYLWKQEIDWIHFSWTHWRYGIGIWPRIWSILCIVIDVGVTGSATVMLGLDGLYAASGGLFLSSLVSFFFFQPRREQKELMKRTRHQEQPIYTWRNNERPQYHQA